MANLVNIVLNATDKTDPAFKKAIDNAKQLSKSGKDLGDVLDVAGRVAQQFGNGALGSLIQNVEGMVNASARMTSGLAGSRLAMLGIAGSAVALAITIGSIAYEFTEASKAAKRLENDTKFFKELEAAQIKGLEIRDKTAASIARINAELQENIEKLFKAQETAGWLNGTVFGLGKTAGYTADQVMRLTGEYNRLAIAQRAAVQKESFDAKAAPAIEESKKRMQSEQEYAERQKQWMAEINQNAQRYNEEFAQKRIEALEAVEAFEEDYQKKQFEGAMGAKSLEEQMNVSKLEGMARLRAQADLDFERRLEQIGRLQLEEDESIRMANAAAQEHAVNQSRLTKAQIKTTMDTSKQMFANIGTAAEAFGKKGLAVRKATGIAQATINTYEAATGAYAAMASIPYVGPALGVAAAAAAIAAGVANIHMIASQQAHGGLGYVPEESTYVLQRGERVLAPRQNEDLQQFLDQQGGTRMESVQVNLQISDRTLARVLLEMSDDGRLKLNSRAIT